jgi:hypothetical protein
MTNQGINMSIFCAIVRLLALRSVGFGVSGPQVVRHLGNTVSFSESMGHSTAKIGRTQRASS